METGMLVIGVAGGSGTGKSTIAAHITRRYGGAHVDADRVAHAVLEEPGVVEAIRRAFGPDVIDLEGGVNRRRLGGRVFADAGARAALNAIVHPAVVRRCQDEVAAARGRGEPVVVVDAALLLEVEMPFPFDLVLALTCERSVRLARILAKGGWSEAEIRLRLDAQAGMEKHFYKADAVIDTGTELPRVLSEVDRLVDAVMESETE
jgi:dephospho-CoA kinase